ncbi:hypothetical protein G9A89_023874 [Geosiphon pyriformis]|nr:hypothetical protein G9A89_023874 [Geosiphon pyriformis]
MSNPPTPPTNLDNVIKEKLKSVKLTPGEVAALRNSKGKIYRHSNYGAMACGAIGFVIGRRKNFRPLGLLAATSGGLILGAQLGMITGSYAAMQSLQKLPDGQRVLKIIKEMQLEALRRRGVLPQPSDSNSSDNVLQHENSTVIFSEDSKDFSDVYAFKSENDYDTNKDEMFRDERVDERLHGMKNGNPIWTTPERQSYPLQGSIDPQTQSSHATSQEKSKPSSAWDKIREEAKIDLEKRRAHQRETHPQSEPKNNDIYNNPIHEDFENKLEGKIKTNKYGDLT